MAKGRHHKFFVSNHKTALPKYNMHLEALITLVGGINFVVSRSIGILSQFVCFVIYNNNKSYQCC